MGRRFSATLGFAVGLGAASLLNLDFYSAMAQRAIASLNAPLSQNAAAQATAVQPFTTAVGCNNNGSPVNSLRDPRNQSISLLKHVPTLPQRLNWYDITQKSAIANAPKPIAPKPVITQWTRVPKSRLGPTEPCLTHPSAMAQSSLSPLKQQAHFILSLASLNPKNDWLLQPQPQAAQPIHHIWHGAEPIEIKLLSKAE